LVNLSLELLVGPNRKISKNVPEFVAKLCSYSYSYISTKVYDHIYCKNCQLGLNINYVRMFLYLWPNCVATHIAIDVEIGVTKYVANYETISMRRKSLMRMCSLAIL